MIASGRPVSAAVAAEAPPAPAPSAAGSAVGEGGEESGSAGGNMGNGTVVSQLGNSVYTKKTCNHYNYIRQNALYIHVSCKCIFVNSHFIFFR